MGSLGLRHVAAPVSRQDALHSCERHDGRPAGVAGQQRPAHGRAAQTPDQTVLAVCNNDRVETAYAMRGAVGKLLKKHKKPLLVALDWVDVRKYQALMASGVIKGRSVPLCWASCDKHVYDGHKSRNAFDEALPRVLPAWCRGPGRCSCWPTGASGGRNRRGSAGDRASAASSV